MGSVLEGYQKSCGLPPHSLSVPGSAYENIINVREGISNSLQRWLPSWLLGHRAGRAVTRQ